MATAWDLCSLAWGDQEGHVFLSVRDPRKDKEDPDYWKDVSFKWPQQKEHVEHVLQQAKTDSRDVYWAPAVFSSKHRSKKSVLPLTTLWADCDNGYPDLPDDLKPTAVWRTSPGHYQALWQLTGPIDPKVHESLNQKLTYAIGADKGGWDLTQVLRVPETPNHKYDNVDVSKPKLNGSVIDPLKVLALDTTQDTPTDSPKLSPEDPKRILKKYKIPPRAKQILRSRNAQVGTRSDRLWEVECLLAEAGMPPEEIVAVVKPTVWNKFDGRTDEIERLWSEAWKATRHVITATAKPPDEVSEVVLADDDDTIKEDTSEPIAWDVFDKDHQPVKWLVEEVWGEAEVGFISGLPKSYKSWLAIDLAVSVATGTRFLGAFGSKKANVLLIQEEDPKPVIQDRLVQVGAEKGLIWLIEKSNTEIQMKYDLPDNLFIISNQGFQITDDEWMERLEEWIRKYDIKLVIMDPLMMMAEGVDEFKAFEMMAAVFKPLKRLRASTQAAMCIIHHHTKTEKGGHSRAASMYGSVALWAWEEAGVHLSVDSPGVINIERFSKHSQMSSVTLTIGDIEERGWNPDVSYGTTHSGLLDLITSYDDGLTIEDLINQTGEGRDKISRQLKALEERDIVEKYSAQRSGKGRKPEMWRVKRKGV